MKKPHISTLTVFVERRSLGDVLMNTSIKLICKVRLKMLHGISLGLAYLHSLHPEIIHSDLKPSNILVGTIFHVLL